MRKDLRVSWIYFLIHLFVEVVCFQMLYMHFQNITMSWVIALAFDFFAFVPQSIFGKLSDTYHKLNIGLIGGTLMFIAVLIFMMTPLKALGIILVALGNAMIHEMGAIATTTVSNGKLAHSAIFVGGGSFGVIIGQTFGSYQYSMFISLTLCLVVILMIQLSNQFWIEDKRVIPCFNLTKEKMNPWIIILIAFMVVVVRSYIGYAIPIAWKKELWQSFLLFFIMGAGKVMGGILSDKFGAKQVGVISTLLCIPFLLIGNNHMIISIIGVFMFSLTMSITFGMLLSVIKNSPGVAFGVTTIGLFIGVLPVFVFGTLPLLLNNILIVILSILCAIGLYKTLK